MTADSLNWEPNAPIDSTQEEAMTNHKGVILPHSDRGQTFVINTLSSMMTDAANITDNENFGIALEQQVTISVAMLDSMKTAPGRIQVDARGSAHKIDNFFAPNIIFRVGSCIYMLYDLTCQVWLKNSIHNQSYGVLCCSSVFLTSD